MPGLPTTYEQQAEKLRRTNMLFLLTLGSLIGLLLFILIAIGVTNAGKVARQNEAQSQLIKTETAKNRQRGDTLVCIIGIPAGSRTQMQIDSCFKKYGLDRTDFIATPQ